MKRFLTIAVALVSIAAVSAQDRSATIIQIDFNCLFGIRTSPSYDIMAAYPEKLGFTFTNTKPINVRMAIYIPDCDYAQSIFPLTDEEIAQRDAYSSLFKSNKTIGVNFMRNDNQIIRSGEEGFAELEKQEANKIQATIENDNKNFSSLLRASSSPYEWGMSDLHMVIQDGTDGQLDDNIAQLKATAFTIWRSDWQDDSDFKIATDIAPPTLPLQHFEPGTNTAFFQYYGYSNRKGDGGKKIERNVYDEIYFVLENADTNEILAIAFGGFDGAADYRLLSREINSDYVTESAINTENEKEVYFIVTDGTCDYTTIEAAKKLQTLFDDYDRNCANGVVAYAVKDNVQGELKALEPSDITWKLTANIGTRNPNLFKDSNGKYYLDGTYYLKSVNYKSFDDKDLTMGTGRPFFSFDLKPITFNHFPLLMPKSDDFAAGIKKVKTEEVKVVWKDNIPYMVINGQELKADIYDLTGKKVRIIERSKFYIVQAQTADGKKYAQKIIR